MICQNTAKIETQNIALIMRDNIIKKLLIIILFLASTQNVQANTDCYWIKNNICPQEKPIMSQVDQCQNRDNLGVCCCGEKNKAPVNEKYIIIGSIFLTFGVITILSFILKKNNES